MEKNSEMKLKKWTVYVMLLMGILFYFVPGKWIGVEKDSIAYTQQRGREGVLPGYPAFLEFFKTLLGEQNYFDGVVVAQSILAIVCTLFFVLVVQKQFKLREWECLLLYLMTMLPFSIYLPEVGITHMILTEGITYAVFYLFFAMVLKSVWTLQYRWYVGSVVFAILLGLIRSQMLVLQAINCFVLLWILWRRVEFQGLKRVGALLAGAFLGIFLAFFSYKIIYKIVEIDNRRIAQVEVQLTEENRKEEQTTQEEQPTQEAAALGQGYSSQFDSLIMSRGFFEADPEDVALFEDEFMQRMFNRTYELAAENERLYNFAGQGLYMWEDLVYDQMARFTSQAVLEYDLENPGERTINEGSIYRELGLKVLIKHFDRYCYHAIRLMLPSFIASVFFQIRPIYLLCHFITLFLYLFAIVGAIVIRRYGGSRAVSDYTLVTVSSLIIMVVVINLVFIGLQRYVVYGMGIFYCAMYLQLKELYLLLRARIGNKHGKYSN